MPKLGLIVIVLLLVALSYPSPLNAEGMITAPPTAPPPPALNAERVTVAFTGTIEQVLNVSGFNSGQGLYGSFTVDTSTLDSVSDNGAVGQYSGALTDLRFTLGSITQFVIPTSEIVVTRSGVIDGWHLSAAFNGATLVVEASGAPGIFANDPLVASLTPLINLSLSYELRFVGSENRSIQALSPR